MASKRVFDPPMITDEISSIYSFTTNVLRDLGLPQWRMHFISSPCHRDAYATVEVASEKHTADLKVCADWMEENLESVRIPTLVHECLHLTHASLTNSVSDEMIQYVPMKIYSELHDRWQRSIELWTDHMSQVILSAWEERIAEWAEEAWGSDWRTIGD